MTDPILTPGPTPDHAPDFWQRLEAQMQSDATSAAPAATDTPAVGRPSAQPSPDHAGRQTTRVLPAASRRIDRDLDGSQRRLWPLVAAAAALALVGLGALLLRPATSADSTDLVIADPDEGSFLGEGNGAGADDGSAAAGVDSTADPAADVEPVTDAADAADAREPAGAASEGGADALPAGAQPARPCGDDCPPEPDASTALMPPTYVQALGNDDVEIWLPTPPLADGSRFLATWEEQDVSWFGVTAAGVDCTDHRHSQIVRVNSSGIALGIGNPQPTFSGGVSHFTLSPDQGRVGFLVECDGQLEFYAARLSPEVGVLHDLQLLWVGDGGVSSALVLWNGDTLSLNALAPNGSPFFVDADLTAGSISGDGAISGGPVGRSSAPVGATSTGSLTWWNADAQSTAGTCDGRELFVRTSNGVFQPALLPDEVEGAAVGGAGVLVVEQPSSQVAFANACPGINTAEVYIGTLRADGFISSIRRIDLSVYGTGSVTTLHWFNKNALRIHLDSSNTGGTIQRYDWVFDEGRDAGFLQSVD